MGRTAKFTPEEAVERNRARAAAAYHQKTPEQREDAKRANRAWYRAIPQDERAAYNRRRRRLQHDYHVRAYRTEEKRIAKQERDKVRLGERWRSMPPDVKAKRYSQDAEYRATPEGQEKRVGSTRLREFGISAAQWGRLLEHQGSSCAICGTTEPGGKGTWNTDHCHATHTLRGILCNGCNSGLGHFRDNPTALRKAVDYLACTPASELGLAVPGAARGKKNKLNASHRGIPPEP